MVGIGIGSVSTRVVAMEAMEGSWPRGCWERLPGPLRRRSCNRARHLSLLSSVWACARPCQRCTHAVLHAVLLFRSQRGCAVYCCLLAHITSVNASAKGNLRAGPGLATGLQTKKLDGLCLGFYCSGVPREDVIGTEAAGVKDWVGKGFMRGPTGLPHAYRETTFDCFKSGKTPREKRSRGRGQKHTGSLREGEAPLPDWPALAFAGGERQFPRAQKERPF